MVRFVILAIVSLLLASAAWAEQRYALLIGNEDYSGDWSLERPHEDVDAIRAALGCGNLGMSTFDGVGGPKDETIGARLMRQSCSAGNDIHCGSLERRGLSRE